MYLISEGNLFLLHTKSTLYILVSIVYLVCLGAKYSMAMFSSVFHFKITHKRNKKRKQEENRQMWCLAKKKTHTHVSGISETAWLTGLFFFCLFFLPANCLDSHRHTCFANMPLDSLCKGMRAASMSASSARMWGFLMRWGLPMNTKTSVIRCSMESPATSNMSPCTQHHQPTIRLIYEFIECNRLVS